jgi:thioredoxin:protein disulfide reductase
MMALLDEMRTLLRSLLLSVFFLASPAAVAQEFLDPAVAFVLTAHADSAKRVRLHFAIAKGYYLYQEQFRFASPDAVLESPRLPPSQTKFDAFFNKDVNIFRNAVDILLPVVSAGKSFSLQVTSQGCADAGLCYPPHTQTVSLSLTGFGGDGTAQVQPDTPLGKTRQGDLLAGNQTTTPEQSLLRQTLPQPEPYNSASAAETSSLWQV